MNPPEDSAGMLIDEAGWKGSSKGNVEVSPVHANYFINRGSASCRDFLDLMREVRTAVKEKSGVSLKPEIKVAGRGI